MSRTYRTASPPHPFSTEYRVMTDRQKESTQQAEWLREAGRDQQGGMILASAGFLFMMWTLSSFAVMVLAAWLFRR